MNTNEEVPKTQLRVSNEPTKFVRDVIWVGISQLLVALVSVVTIPALTKSYSTETYGVWIQVSVTESLMIVLLNLDLGTAVVRFLAGEEDKAIRLRSLGSMLSAIFIFAFLLMVPVSLLAPQLSILLFNSTAYTTFVRLTFLWTFADALFGFFISYLRARGKIKGLSIIQVSMSLCKMAIIVLLAKLGLGLIWIVVCIVFIELIYIFGIFGKIIREEGFPKPNLVGIKVFLGFSVPQIPADLFVWIISGSDRYFITHFLGLSNNGIYSTSNSLGSLISLLFSPISFVLLPTVSKAWGQNQKMAVKNYFEYSTKLFLLLAIPAAAGIALLSQPVLKILTTSQYLAGWELVFFIAVGTIACGIYQINEYIIYLIRQTKWLPIMVLAASITSVGMNLILIPKMGIIGASIANIISYTVLAAIVTIIARKAISYKFNFKFLSKVIAATLVMSLCIYLLKVNSIVSIILASIVGTAIFFSVLFLLRTFSEQDKRITMQVLVDVVPWLKK